MSTTHVTKHFTWAEFDCNSGEPVPPEAQPYVRQLCELVLEPVRARWSGPIIVVSGWRSRLWNTRVGGAKGSYHLSGEAADIRPVDVLRTDVLRGLIEDMIREGELPAVGGIGAYKSWVHVDIRTKKRDGHIARWAGKGMGSEETA